MYIWVVLATFLAILASYTLSPREDVRKLTVEPLAEVYIAKMVTQHEAALSYVNYRKKPYTTTNRNEFAPIALDKGLLNNDLDDTENYFPVGHSYTGEFFSKIYCMDETAENALSIVNVPDACQNKKNKKAVVTFAPIPLRWLNTHVDPERPNVDFLNAMKNTVHGGIIFGYIAKTEDTTSVKNISHSPVLLINRDNEENYIYKAIADDSDFREMCNVDEGNICLVYQSDI